MKSHCEILASSCFMVTIASCHKTSYFFVTLASTTKKVAASNTDHYRRFHCSLK